MKEIKSREFKFNKWWNKNRKTVKSHQWLVTHARRISFSYNLHSQTFDEIIFIWTRWNNSEHKKLNQSDAHKLWRIVNPLPHERLDMIREESRKLQHILVEVKKERQQLRYDKANVTVKKTRSYSLPDPTK